MKRKYGLLLLMLFSPLVWASPSFADLSFLFGESSLIVGQNASDRIAASVLANAFMGEGLKIIEGSNEKGSLILVGGPLANSLSAKYSSMFGITIKEDESSVILSCEGRSISHKKSNTYEDIAIAYLGKDGKRNVLLLFGYGRKGTHASCLYLSKKENWTDTHLLLIMWKDKNRDGIVSLSEVEADDKEKQAKLDTINVTLILDYGKRQEKIETEVKKGATVLDLLRQETQVDYTIYPFGVFVTSINGLGNDNTTGYYWLFWVNGIYATMAADAFVLQEGDVVEWRYKKP